MRFSIVIPNYNYGEFVGAAIESALALEWPDVEVIVVDDGSTDHSRSVIESFGDKVVAIFQSNATQRVACNTGFARATGEAILFLDSDDVVHPRLAKAVAQVWRPGLSKVQVQMLRIDAQGRALKSIFPSYRPMPTPATIRDWAARTTAHPTPPGSGNIYAKTYLDRLFPLDDSCGAFSDSACVAAAPFLGEVETIAEPLVCYRVHGANDSNVIADKTRFAREIRRAQARYAFACRMRGATAVVPGTRSPIFRSLEVLQFRVASLRLTPSAHPLDGDDWLRAAVDAVRVPWGYPAATRKQRLSVAIWAILTLLTPLPLARTLIAFRYSAR